MRPISASTGTTRITCTASAGCTASYASTPGEIRAGWRLRLGEPPRQHESGARSGAGWPCVRSRTGCGGRRLVLGTVGSTLSLQARMPPFMLRTLRKPACFRRSTALALRMPLLQCATISASLSSSLRRFGRSPSGISFEVGMRQIWYSCSSRTSTRTNVVAAVDLLLHFSGFDFSECGGHRLDLIVLAAGSPQNCW